MSRCYSLALASFKIVVTITFTCGPRLPVRSRPLVFQLLPINDVPSQTSTTDDDWTDIFRKYSDAGGITIQQAARIANVERYNADNSQNYQVCLGWRSQKGDGTKYPAMLRVNAGCDEFQGSGSQWAMRFFFYRTSLVEACLFPLVSALSDAAPASQRLSAGHLYALIGGGIAAVVALMALFMSR